MCIPDDLRNLALVFRPSTTPHNKCSLDDWRSKPLKAFDQENKDYIFHVPCSRKTIIPNVQIPPTTQSTGNSSDFMTIAIDARHIFCSSTNPSFRMVDANPELTRHYVRDDAETLAHALECEEENPLSIPVHKRDVAMAPSKYIPTLLHKAGLRNVKRQMAHEESERVYLSKVKHDIESWKRDTCKRNSHRLWVRRRCLRDSIFLLCETYSEANGKEWCTGENVWLQYRVLGTLINVHGIILQTCDNTLLICPPCSEVYPRRPEETVPLHRQK